MVAWDGVTLPEVADYREIAKEIMDRCLKRSRMSQTKFAEALTQELTGTPGRRPTNPVQVSKWASGVELPKSDVLLAALNLAGLPYEDILGDLDPLSSMRERYRRLQQHLDDLEGDGGAPE